MLSSEIRSSLLGPVHACLSIALLLCPVSAKPGRLHLQDDLARKASAALYEEVNLLNANPSYDYRLPIIVQVEPDFFRRNSKFAQSGSPSINLALIHSYQARLTAADIRLLLLSPLVEYVALDARIRTTAKVGKSSNAFLETIGVPQTSSDGPGETGAVVAVFDSGIGRHPGLGPGKRVLAAVDFTTGMPVLRARNVDRYGHGTAVAGLIGGRSPGNGLVPIGVEPGVRFVDVKVVGEDGTGSTSNLIQAIGWVIRHKERYGIQLANMSLGHPPLESYKRDPLCRAVRKLVSTGIVTLVSAGNLGKTKNYPKIWGSITSPGIDPSVITVSPIDTNGTASHADDVATSFGSRGPTYKDNLFKPDLSAPGKNVITLLEDGSRIETEHPEVQVGKQYAALSGASMATAYVAGAVALLIQNNPSLTPNLCKLILLVTAIKLRQPSMLEQGNGLLNVHDALKLALAVDVERRDFRGAGSLGWSIGEERVWPGGAFALGSRVVYPEILHSLGNPSWGDGRFWNHDILRADGIFWTDGVFWSDASFGSEEVF